MTGLFHRIEDAHVVTLTRGVYRQSHVYKRGGMLFAAHSSGFISLRKAGGTSLPNTNWDHIEGVAFAYDRLGRMMIDGSEQS